MRIWEKLSNLDRRIIFLMIFLAVLLPLIFPIKLPITGAQPPVKATYDYIESLAPGSVVLISISYDPGTMPELYPMTIAAVRHCFMKNLRVLGVSLTVTGVGIGESALKETAAEYNKKEGIDFVYLGFKPGPVPIQMGENIHTAFPTDYKGMEMNNLPMMSGVKTYKDIALIMDFTASGTPYIIYAVTKYKEDNVRLALGVTAVGAADYYMYLQTKQLVGLLGGLRSAAEYEVLINKPDKGCVRMDSQSFAHLLIIALILLGNVTYFVVRKKKATQ